MAPLILLRIGLKQINTISLTFQKQRGPKQTGAHVRVRHHATTVACGRDMNRSRQRGVASRLSQRETARVGCALLHRKQCIFFEMETNFRRYWNFSVECAVPPKARGRRLKGREFSDSLPTKFSLQLVEGEQRPTMNLLDICCTAIGYPSQRSASAVIRHGPSFGLTPIQVASQKCSWWKFLAFYLVYFRLHFVAIK